MPETVRVDVDLSGVYSAINGVNHNIGVVAQHIDAVRSRVDAVAHEQADTKKLVEGLIKDFLEYREKDEWVKYVSTARQELQLSRQELEKKFGQHDRVRDLATNILQAVDVGIVREETIRSATESMMLSCGEYWLAPGLVGLSAWISDNQPLAEKALAEAIRRDDSKASLFFALICRRGRRMDACARWLVRYFQIQNPASMDPEVVVMLDAMANGVFGGTALTACSTIIDEWLTDLEQQAEFPSDQRKRWAEAIGIMTPTLGSDEYPTLRKYSRTWPRLEATLAGARRHQVVQSFFQKLFTGEIIVPQSLEATVDDVLKSLVKNFHNDELPLRRKTKFNEIVIEVDGLPGRYRDKKAEADRRFAGQKDSLKEKTNFAALLTNSAMYPDRYGATKATQRYAVSRSRQWIIAGFNDLTARDRAQVPAEVEVVLGPWEGVSRDGLNEQKLSADLHEHYASRIEQAVNAVQLGGEVWVALILGGLFGLIIALQGGGAILFGLLIMAAAGAYFYFKHQNLETVRQQARQALEQEREEAGRILKAGLAELADLRREVMKEDGKAADVLELFASLSSLQFVLNRPGQARAIIA